MKPKLTQENINKTRNEMAYKVTGKNNNERSRCWCVTSCGHSMLKEN